MTFDDHYKLVGDYRLCAWATSEVSCRIQTSEPEIARALKRIPDCVLVGYSVTERWSRIFAMPYTLDWVAKNVIERLNLEFPRENEGGKVGNAPQSTGKPSESQHTTP